MTNTVAMVKCASRFVLGVLLLIGLVGVNRLAAQVETATISGTATDSSGAALVGAKVEAKNVGTNVTQSTVSDAAAATESTICPSAVTKFEHLSRASRPSCTRASR